MDIDIHHGDGVEEAFYTTDRVMTVRCIIRTDVGRHREQSLLHIGATARHSLQHGVHCDSNTHLADGTSTRCPCGEECSDDGSRNAQRLSHLLISTIHLFDICL